MNTYLCIDVIEAGVLDGDDTGIELEAARLGLVTVTVCLDPVVVDDALLQMVTYIADIT